MIKEIQESNLLQFFYFVILGGGLFYLMFSVVDKKFEFNKRLFLYSAFFGVTMWFVFSKFVFNN